MDFVRSLTDPFFSVNSNGKRYLTGFFMFVAGKDS